MRYLFGFFFFRQKTAYELRIRDWSSDVCSSDLDGERVVIHGGSGGEISGEAPDRGGIQRVSLIVLGRLVTSVSPRPRRSSAPQIGRASCRERVCQYV